MFSSSYRGGRFLLGDNGKRPCHNDEALPGFCYVNGLLNEVSGS
jgi:hypothetical protein